MVILMSYSKDQQHHTPVSAHRWELWGISVKGCWKGSIGSGLELGDFLEDSRKQGFAVGWMLSESRDSVTGSLVHLIL